MKIITRIETADTLRTLYKEGEKEYWHTLFKQPEHPVNKLWKISGASTKTEI